MDTEEKRQRKRENYRYHHPKSGQTPSEKNGMLMEEKVIGALPVFHGSRSIIARDRSEEVERISAILQKDIRKIWGKMTTEPSIITVEGTSNVSKKIVVYTIECALGRPYSNELRKKFKEAVGMLNIENKQVN